MIRSFLAIAALACSAMLSVSASAAPPLDPVVIHVVASTDEAVTTPTDVIAPAEVRVAEPGTARSIASTGSRTAAKHCTKIATAFRAYRLHVDPGRSRT